MHKHTESFLCTWNIACLGGGVMIREAKHRHEASVLARFIVKLRQNSTNAGGKPCGTYVVSYSGEATCPKLPLRSHRRATKVSSTFSIGRGGSEVGLSSSGVRVSKKKNEREELRRELGNSFSYIVQISSSTESENTVWKLTSDDVQNQEGVSPLPYCPGEIPSFWLVSFNNPTHEKGWCVRIPVQTE